MKIHAKLFLLSTALIFIFALRAHAADKPVFPIAELGNCNNQSDCRTYCDDISHMDACLSYAKAHDLMSDEEIEKASTFAHAAKNLTLPGGAKNPAQAKKYCEDSSHADECLTFAEKNGLIKSDEVQHARKFLSLLKNGQTPGGCNTKDSCETFCRNDANRDVCLKFAEDNGLISKADAQRARQFKSLGGPGGCNSKDSCEAYCNNTDHQQECIDFAEEHGLIKKEDSEKIKDSMGRLRAQVSENPEFKDCLLEALPAHALEKIKNGELVPDKDTGEAVQSCVEKFKNQIKHASEDRLNQAPEQVKTCIKSAVGDHGLDELKSGEAPDPANADKVRACFEKFTDKTDPRDRQNSASDDDSEDGPENAGRGMPEGVKKCILAKSGKDNLQDVSKDELGKLAQACAQLDRNARPSTITPEQIRKSQQSGQSSQSGAAEACLKRLFGEHFKDRIERGEISAEKLQAAKVSCGSVPATTTRPPVNDSGRNISPGSSTDTSE